MKYIKQIRRIAEIISYYLLPAILLGIYFFAPQGLLYELQEELGEYAQWLLLFVLFIKPVSVIFNKIQILRIAVGLRRQLGIATFYLTAAHVLFYSKSIGMNVFALMGNSLQHVDAYFYGAVASIGMFILYITSNRFSTVKLKKWWKRIQRLAYPVLFLVLAHAGLMEGEGYTKVLAIGGLYIAVRIIERWIVLKRKAEKQKKAN